VAIKGPDVDGLDSPKASYVAWLHKKDDLRNFYNYLFLNEYPAACCGWDGQETDLRKAAYSVYK
jgi:hypothetical protein